MKQKLLLPTLVLALIALAIAGLGLVLYQYLPLAQDKIALDRWQACASVYRLEYSDEQNKTVVISPNMAEVKTCVKILEQ
jgi:hypothetical protein